jgi:hypothetical protein
MMVKVEEEELIGTKFVNLWDLFEVTINVVIVGIM